MKTIKISILFVLVISGLTEAQNSRLFEFREFQKALINQTRSRSGGTGAGYWQKIKGILKGH